MALISDSFGEMVWNYLPLGLPAAAGAVCGFLLLWRLWRFSVRPSFCPSEPEQLPYWIPFLGHGLSFARDPQALLAHGQKRLGLLGRPYGLTIAGITFYVLTDPDDFAKVYRNPATFTFGPLVDQVYRAFQIPEDAIRKLHQTPSASSAESAPPEKDGVNISHEMVVVEMRGKLSRTHSLKVMTQLHSMMGLDGICSRFSTNLYGSATVVPLLKFCSVMVAAAGQASYFGDALSSIDPTIPETFLDFDKLSWQVFFRPPTIWAKPLKKSMAKFMKAFEAYLEKPMEQRSDMPHFLQKWENECIKAGLHRSEIAIIMLIHYFGLNTNTPKACFWLFCHILFNPKLIHIIRNETSPAFASDTFDYGIIEKSQTLSGIWLETLRLSTASLSFRHITQDFEMKGFTLRKGNQVILNPRPMHIDPNYFGADPLAFDTKRFIDEPKYQRHPAFRPFGGGEAQCPGRQMAKQTALTFVAYVLHEYEVDLAWPQEFPEPSQESHPGVAVMIPAEGEDLLVRLTQRPKHGRG